MEEAKICKELEKRGNGEGVGDGGWKKGQGQRRQWTRIKGRWGGQEGKMWSREWIKEATKYESKWKVEEQEAGGRKGEDGGGVRKR